MHDRGSGTDGTVGSDNLVFILVNGDDCGCVYVITPKKRYSVYVFQEAVNRRTATTPHTKVAQILLPEPTMINLPQSRGSVNLSKTDI